METLQALSTIASVLRKEVGWSWPLFLAGCLGDSKTLFSGTRWAADGAPPAETRYLRQFALIASIYLRLKEQFGPARAIDAMGRIMVPTGCASARRQLDSLDASHEPGVARLMAFNEAVQAGDLGSFGRREYLAVTDSLCHYVEHRCLVWEFFTQVGTPELAMHLCQVDHTFFPQAFPEFTFSRGDSWENTIAYGRNRCEFILEKKA